MSIFNSSLGGVAFGFLQIPLTIGFELLRIIYENSGLFIIFYLSILEAHYLKVSCSKKIYRGLYIIHYIRRLHFQ